MYTWKITKPPSFFSPNDYQYLIFIQNWELKYYANRSITRSLIKQEEALQIKIQWQQTWEIIKNIVSNSGSRQAEIDEYNKSIEYARKIIEQRQSNIAPIEQKQSSVTSTEVKIIRKLTPINERKAILIQKRIQLLKKQLELLEKQLNSLN